MTEKLYDFSEIDAISGGDIGVRKNIVQLFLDSTTSDILKMQKSIDRMEKEVVCSIAHKIKPSLNYIAIKRIYEAVREIEYWKEEDLLMKEKCIEFIKEVQLLVKQLKQIDL